MWYEEEKAREGELHRLIYIQSCSLPYLTYVARHIDSPLPWLHIHKQKILLWAGSAVTNDVTAPSLS